MIATTYGGLQPVLAPQKKHHTIHHFSNDQNRRNLNFLRINFDLSTLMLVGAVLQCLAFLVTSFSFRLQLYVSLIPLGLAAARMINAWLVVHGFKPNTMMNGVVKGRAHAFVPEADGSIVGKATQPIVVFILGTRSNHPYGAFTKKFLEMGSHLQKMSELFDGAEPPAGFMGQTDWHRPDANGGFELCYISYWRSIADLHAFAHGQMHLDAWRWWDNNVKQLDLFGIYHEAYEVPANSWENIYANCQPTMFGATSVLRKPDGEFKEGKVDEEWIMPLVKAKRGAMVTASKRMNKDESRPDGIDLVETYD